MNEAGAVGAPATASPDSRTGPWPPLGPTATSSQRPAPKRLALRPLHHVEPEGRGRIRRPPSRSPARSRRWSSGGAGGRRDRAGRRRAGPGAAPGSAASRPRSARGPGRRWEPGGRADARPCWEPMIPVGAWPPGVAPTGPGWRPDVVSACADPRDRPRRRRRQPVRRRDAEAVRPPRRRPDPAAHPAGRSAPRPSTAWSSSPTRAGSTRPASSSRRRRSTCPSTVVAGGATRNESTRNGLAALDGADDDVVVVHDAVRPLVPLDVIQRSIEPILSGRADGDRHRDPERRHAGHRRGRPGRRDPGPEPLPARPDAADLPARRPRARLRGGRRGRATCRRPTTAASSCGTCPGARIVAVAGDEVNLKITTRIDMVMADRMLQMKVMAPIEEPEAERVARGPAAARRRRHERHRARDRRRGDAARRDGRGRRRLAGPRRPRLRERRVAPRGGRGAAWAASTTSCARPASCASGRSPKTAADELAEVVDVNLTGTLNVARAAYPWLRRSRGSLTVFASSSFTRGRPDYVAYSASKAALVNLTQGLAEEWADDGIRVNAVSPERTDTPMRRKAFPGESPDGLLRRPRRSRSRRCGSSCPT